MCGTRLSEIEGTQLEDLTIAQTSLSSQTNALPESILGDILSTKSVPIGRECSEGVRAFGFRLL
jgi:hypothetical protein